MVKCKHDLILIRDGKISDRNYIEAIFKCKKCLSLFVESMGIRGTISRLEELRYGEDEQ